MTKSVGITLFFGNIGAKVGVIDGAIGVGTSASSGDGVGTITGTIQSITSVAGLIPGPIGGLGNAIAVGVTIGKVGGTNQMSWGDVLGVIGGVAGIIAATAAAPGVVTLGAAVSLAAGAGSLTYTIWNFPSLQMQVISPTLGTTPDPLVKTIRYVDPLILDLDGDGLEITALSKGIVFDANGDTIKTGTAWAGADDGMLVWDRNGNGQIDSGRELFGDETVLANGQKAAHGFAALSELDTGSVVGEETVGAGDGVFDDKDAQYASLRIWRDLNQDGVSQAGELQTLAQAGIKSINLAHHTTNDNYRDAILTHSGSYTRGDGSEGQAGSFILAQNNFVREFPPIALSDAAKALPGIKGCGWVQCASEQSANDSVWRRQA